MDFRCMLVLFAVELTITAISVAAQAKPGCQSTCGIMTIPYPFGTGNNRCNISSNFFITCNTTFDPPRAFLPSGHYWPHGPTTTGTPIEVLHISLDGYLRISEPVGYDCYNASGHRIAFFGTRNRLPFSISHARNKFTTVGCDTIVSVGKALDSKLKYSSGCLTFCDNVSDAINGSCSGIGCCQTSIPKGVYGYELKFDSPSHHRRVSGFNPCSYGFVAEDGAYTFSVSDLYDTKFIKKKLPMILDWTIGDRNCTEAKKDPENFACKDNSVCMDTEDAAGYLCKCVDGFQGNPYLSHGCQDINECETMKPCNGTATCDNIPGSYHCSCPEEFEGDGRKNGTGCSLIQDQEISTSLVTVVICIDTTLFVFACVWWLYETLERRIIIKQKKKFFKTNGGLLLQKKLSSTEGGLNKAKLFGSEELETATDHYNENRILGCGGQGTVYKGMLQDGRIVAVKKSKIVNQGNLEQFINEIVILSRIDHRNVVGLLGCCLETEVPLLVYEFVPNGTLSHFIHDQNDEYPRSWSMRLRIAAEVASAVSYLHSYASVPVYHRDIKSCNVLLDEKFRAKVSDFGTSRSVEIDQTHLTTEVRGTFGYLDPEYFRSNRFTEKSDVYSFGVVLVELLTRQKPISPIGSQEMRGLASYFVSSMEENNLLDIVDAEIMKDCDMDELVAVADLARRCLNFDGRFRPTMKEVAMELERIRTSQDDCVPIRPQQAEFVVTTSTESRYSTSFSTEPNVDCSIISTPESDGVHLFEFHTV